MDYRDLKYRIVKENLNLPAYEIKKKLKVKYPDITNEELEKIIIEIGKASKDKREEKDAEEEMEL